MTKPIVTAALLCLLCPKIMAQKKTEHHWGSGQHMDIAYSAAATNDGGYIITGLTADGPNDSKGDIVVIKITAKGDTQWSFTYGGPELEGGNNVIQTSDGGYMVSGHTEDFGAKDCDAFLMKLDKDGNHQWFKVYGGDADDIGEGVLELPDGGYIFAGITASYGNPAGNTETRHLYFVRTNSTGDVKWSKYYSGGGAEYALSIAAMPQGGFLAVGWSMSYGNGERDGWLLHLNDVGDTTWTRLCKNTGDTRYLKIIPTQDNGYAITGYTTPALNGKPRGLLIKLDAKGQELWKKTYGTDDGMQLEDIAQLPNGNFMLSGLSYAHDTLGAVCVLITGANGAALGSEEECGGGGSYATSIAVQGNNSYLVAGISRQYGDERGDLYYMLTDNTESIVPGVNTSGPRMFPNPVKDKSLIILPNGEAYQHVSVAVTAVDGRLMYRRENIMAKDIVISREALPHGSYLFRVQCQDGTVYNGKFVVD